MSSTFPSGAMAGAGGHLGRGLLNIAEFLAKRHEVTVIAPRNSPAVLPEKQGGIRFHWIDPPKPEVSLRNIVVGPRSWMVFAWFVGLASRLKDELESSWDSVTGFWAMPSGWIATEIAGRTPAIVACLGSDLHLGSRTPLIRALLRRSLTKAAATICVSMDLLTLAKDLGASEAYRLPIPVDFKEFPLIPTGAENDELVYLGRLSREKNLKAMLRAVQILRTEGEDVRLTICGNGPLRKHLMSTARAMGLDREIRWTGWIDPKEIVSILGRAKCLVLSSRHEGLPSAALEAMAVGRPVVAPNVGDLQELVTGDTGVLARSAEPRDLAEAIFRCLDTDFDATLIREHVTPFDVQAVGRRWEQIYENVLTC